MTRLLTLYYRARYGGLSAVLPAWAMRRGVLITAAGVVAFIAAAVAART